MHVTDCECTEPGWCERHKCHKSKFIFESCRRRRDFFRAWENGGLRHLCRSDRAHDRKKTCVHRGQELRKVRCETCTGNVQVKIFACSVYSECVIGSVVENLTSCVLCDSYQAQDDQSLTRGDEGSTQTPEVHQT